MSNEYIGEAERVADSEAEHKILCEAQIEFTK